jgi:hypothetical protein
LDAGTIQTIANHSDNIAVYAENVQLAAHLASEATKLWEAMLERVVLEPMGSSELENR